MIGKYSPYGLKRLDMTKADIAVRVEEMLKLTAASPNCQAASPTRYLEGSATCCARSCSSPKREVCC